MPRLPNTKHVKPGASSVAAQRILSPGSRISFRALQCGCQPSCGDDELRREVESLLRFQPQAKDFIEQPAGRDLRSPLDAALQRHGMRPGGSVGRVLGVYELQSWIAAGVAGIVANETDRNIAALRANVVSGVF